MARPFSSDDTIRILVKRVLIASPVVIFASVAALGGCSTAPLRSEWRAREQVDAIGAEYRPQGRRPELPVLAEGSPLRDFVRFGVLNHPQVEAAFYDWRASVEAITPARSLPDPRLTFQADVTDMLMTLMPGLMFDLMSSGKRAAMGEEAVAGGGVAYRAYAATVARTAAAIQKAWVELAYAEETRRLYAAILENVEQSLAVAGAEFSTGRGTVSLDEMVRLQNLIAEHHAHHAAVGDRLVAARVRFKAALGLGAADRDPPWPSPVLAATAIPPEDELWRRAQLANPELASLRAMVAMAVAEMAVARKATTPDFAIGAMADVKASPLMVRPTASLQLPIWRDKINATIAAARARHDAAVARLDARQLDVAAELAQLLFMVREADRMIDYIDRTALPNLDRAASSAAAGYESGRGAALMISDARHMQLNMRLERAKALRERELAAADLLTLIAGEPPAGAPLLAEASTRKP